MNEISPPTWALFLSSPRPANYVSALIREGDSFDYCRWLQEVRAEEAQAKLRPQTTTSGKIRVAEIGPPTGTPDCRKASPSWTLFTRNQPIPGGLHRSHREPLGSTSSTRIRRWFEKIRDGWDDFQASRARDAVYGYLEAVFAIVTHYKVRRKTKTLLRHAFKFANLPLNNSPDLFTAVIRCTSGDAVDNKMISKWARALRYVAHCNVPRTRLKMFMKKAGGVNACAGLYARRCKRDSRRSPCDRN
jgi:hypothetical protein